MDKLEERRYFWERVIATDPAQDLSNVRGEEPIYLASPYSHASALVKELRWRAAEENMARLLNSGKETCIFQPIVQCHMLAERHAMPSDFEFWMKFDLALVRALPRFGVLRLPGWNVSAGVFQEGLEAKKLGRVIEFFEPKGDIFEALQKLA